MTDSLDAYLTAEAARITSACTACGDCVRVCPVVGFGRARDVPPAEVAGGILGLLRDGQDLPDAAYDWMTMCNGCTACIPVCPEKVDPRHMLMIAAHRASERQSATPDLFKRMARAIKLMVAMQLIPEEFKRLFIPGRRREAEVIFYTGCNALRTPHLLFNTMYVLDALEIDYDVVGGPSACCGVIAAKWEGRIADGERQTRSVMTRFAGTGRVLNWCPTCELHLTDTLGGFTRPEMRFDHVTAFLAEHMAERALSFPVAIPGRAVLHGHVGSPGITGAVETLLRQIPGLELIETVMESGYTCGGSGCSKTPELAAREHAEALDRAEALGADLLVTLFHGCHGIFVAGGRGRPFEVVNFTDLLARALGQTPHPDTVKELQKGSDLALLVDEVLPMLRANGLTVEGDWLMAHLPALFRSAEFKGGLEVLSTSRV